MKRWEEAVRPDMLFCGAPHLLIPHAPMGRGEPVQDVLIAGTYFELLAASRGLGVVMLTFPLGVLNLMPQVKSLLEIPEEHYIGMLIGFGYPEIRYARGAGRKVGDERIHRVHFRKGDI
jgi:nitroreductase